MQLLNSFLHKRRHKLTHVRTSKSFFSGPDILMAGVRRASWCVSMSTHAMIEPLRTQTWKRNGENTEIEEKW